MSVKIPFIADVSTFLKGTDDIEQALEDVSDQLDDLSRKDTEVKIELDSERVETELKEIGTEAETQAEKMEKSFTDSFTELKRQGRIAGKEISKGVKDGVEEDKLTSEDVFKGELKAELVSNMTEAGAEVARGLKDGFDSEDLSTIVDGLSDTIVQVGALGGPIGAAAGLAAASAMNLLIGPALAQAKEDAKTYEDTFTTAFDNIIEAGTEMGRELTIQQSTDKLLKDAEKLAVAQSAAESLGISVGVALRAMAGDTDALAVAQAAAAETSKDSAATQKDLNDQRNAGLEVTDEELREGKVLLDQEYASQNALKALNGEYQNHTNALDAAAEATKFKAQTDEIAAGKAIEAATATAKQTGEAQDLTVNLNGVSTAIRVMPNGKIVKVTDDGTAKLTQEEIDAIKGKSVTVTVSLTPANQTMSDYLSGNLFKDQSFNVEVGGTVAKPKLGRMVPQ